MADLELVVERCAGIDVHQAQLRVCVRNCRIDVGAGTVAGKRIRRQVHDAHHQRAIERQFKFSAEQLHQIKTGELGSPVSVAGGDIRPVPALMERHPACCRASTSTAAAAASADAARDLP